MNLVTLLAWIAAGAAVLMLVLWGVQFIRRDATIVDVGWSFGMLGAAIWLGLAGGGDVVRSTVSGMLVALWAARLGTYLLLNRVVGRTHEDGRYQRMRAAMGRWAQPGFLLFFLAQALFVVIFSMPLVPAFTSPRAWDCWAWLGCAIWLVAVSGEIIADVQLARFRANPLNRGRTCQTGLWRRSRHPNYFFEWLHWWAYIPLGLGSPYWWLALLGPVIMYVFLRYLTGIPHTEQQALSHRPDYAEYQRTTPVFFPRLFIKETLHDLISN